jgi:hypothetical protein
MKKNTRVSFTVAIMTPVELKGFTPELMQWSVNPMWMPSIAKGTVMDPASVATHKKPKRVTMYTLLLKIALTRKKKSREVAGTAAAKHILMAT